MLHNKYQQFLLATLCSCLIFVNCSILGPIINEKLNESFGKKEDSGPPPNTEYNEELTQDLTPPSNYKPNFLSSASSNISSAQSTLPESKPDFLDIQISRVETNNPNKINTYLHFIDQNGNYISGAAAKELKEYWCGVEEKWDTLSYTIEDYEIEEETAADSIPLAMCIAMDHSGSMGHHRVLAVQRMVSEFINHKRKEDALAIVKFDHHVQLEVPLLTDINNIQSQFQQNGLWGYNGGTAILDGISNSIDELVRHKKYENRRHVVIFTDGYENSSSISKSQVVDKAIENGVIVHTIGFGGNIDRQFLQDIAWRTGGMYRQMYMTSEFNYVFDDSYFRQKNFYRLSYKPQNYGALNITIKLCLPEGEKEISTQVYYPPPKKNVPALISILFPFDKYMIPKKYIPEVEKVHNLMTQIYPKCKIELHGHTCDKGDEDYNQQLSENRANAVKDALVKRGISKDRIKVVGFGESSPVVPNDSEENRKINRRTEFIITETGE